MFMLKEPVKTKRAQRTKRITVYLSDWEHEELGVAAANLGLSMADIVRCCTFEELSESKASSAESADPAIIKVLVTPAEAEQINAEAKRRGITVSSLVRSSLRRSQTFAGDSRRTLRDRFNQVKRQKESG